MNVLNPDNLRIPTEPGATPCLLGSQCGACGKIVFPQIPVCPACGANGAMKQVEIGRTGKLYSHTIAYFAPKGFKAPFFQVFIDLPEGPRVFSLVGADCPVERGAMQDGMEMRLIVEPIADTPERRDQLTYKYVPVRSSGSNH